MARATRMSRATWPGPKSRVRMSVPYPSRCLDNGCPASVHAWIMPAHVSTLRSAFISAEIAASFRYSANRSSPRSSFASIADAWRSGVRVHDVTTMGTRALRDNRTRYARTTAGPRLDVANDTRADSTPGRRASNASPASPASASVACLIAVAGYAGAGANGTTGRSRADTERRPRRDVRDDV